MLDNYGYIGLYIFFSICFATLIVIIPLILRLIKVVPHKPNALKLLTFECGMETIGKTWVRFNFRFYFYALVFLALDVLVVFLYPWAANLKGLGTTGFIAILVLLLIVIVGYMYAWRKKVLEWK
ncbi:MAG: NADH-quinone oxidoreductase subunit A [Dehalococcoidales bacterium]|nr:NADH-quinone oxidoreductase subunit A [Dehalococcoidales bacterium]